jgi:hypothetical protein
VKRLGDHQADEGIAEEFEALVVTRRALRVLMQPAAVDERPRQERGIRKRDPDPLGELDRVRRGGCVPRPGRSTGQLACSSM